MQGLRKINAEDVGNLKDMEWVRMETVNGLSEHWEEGDPPVRFRSFAGKNPL
ncbi:MAG: hypothetical protein CM15mP4_2750 [Candidatus Neomarinimicrobiota bacterium]|nr:MAG: hypothetical protein CM15mP4_2750 [Candidatus Neomarinimicrobiota bacterium]